MNSTESKADPSDGAPAAPPAITKSASTCGSLEAMSLWHDPAIKEERNSEMDFCPHPTADDFREGDPEGLGYCRLM